METVTQVAQSINYFPFLILPKELQFLIIQQLDAISLLSASLTCKLFYQICRNENIWKICCLNLFPDIKRNCLNWREYFYLRCLFLTPDTLKWQSLTNIPGLPSVRQSITGNSVKGKIVFIGGQTSLTTRFDEIFVFDPEPKVFSKIKTKKNSPPKFARHAAATVDTKIYMFGGFDGFNQFFGLQIFDFETSTWTIPDIKGKSPIARTNHTLVYLNNKLYLFGGNDTTRGQNSESNHYGTYGDFQMFDLETFTWTEIEAKGILPSPRSGHQMVVVGTLIYLFGGGLWQDSSKSWLKRYNDMFYYDSLINQWTKVETEFPPNQTFISVPHWVVGTFIFVFTDPLYCFDTVTCLWHSIKTKGTKPQKRFLGPAVYLEEKSSVYMFGGVYTSILNNFDQLIWKESLSKLLISNKFKGQNDLLHSIPVQLSQAIFPKKKTLAKFFFSKKLE